MSQVTGVTISYDKAHILDTIYPDIFARLEKVEEPEFEIPALPLLFLGQHVNFAAI